MITGIDHIRLCNRDPSRIAADYATLLGRDVHDGRLELENAAIGFTAAAPDLASDTTDLGLVLAATDLASTVHRLRRRALSGELDEPGSRFDIDKAATYDVPVSIVAAHSAISPADPTHDIAGLDHVVVRTPDPERAVALYGGRLGLDLRLDRTSEAYGSRMLFFVCGGLVIEITHDQKAGVDAGPDLIRGLAWRARDIDRAHARMSRAGIAVSELRTGRRPGTRVFTVRSQTAGVPTLVIGGEGLERH